jgi:sodium-coupled neutral amino acid transporter 11
MLVEMATFHPRLKGHGVLTFEDLMMLPYGKLGHHFILASMLITAYGAMVAYLLIVKDTLPVVLGLEDEPGQGGFVQRELVMMVTSLVIMLPLSMLRDMSTLAITSFFSVICDTILVVFIAAFSPIKETVGAAGGFGTVVKENWINSGFFIGFGVLTIAMTCQHSVFIVAGSLGNLTSARWASVTFRSLSLSCLLCAILGITGYLGFLDDTQGDILNNFDPDTMQASAARMLLAITMFFTYP